MLATFEHLSLDRITRRPRTCRVCGAQKMIWVGYAGFWTHVGCPGWRMAFALMPNNGAYGNDRSIKCENLVTHAAAPG